MESIKRKHHLSKKIFGMILILIVGSLSASLNAQEQALAELSEKNPSVSSSASPPERLTPLQLQYPEDAKNKKIEGDVILMLTINEKGVVEETELIQGGPHGLTEAALEAAEDLRFKPAFDKTKGEAVSCFYTLTCRFRLVGGGNHEAEASPRKKQEGSVPNMDQNKDEDGKYNLSPGMVAITILAAAGVAYVLICMQRRLGGA